jgi:DnaJ family protein B protein 4
MGGMHQGPVKDKPITRHLGCTLEELYSGSTRKMKITRTIFDGSGRVTRSEEEILELNVKPGWKKGTKLTFQQKGGSDQQQPAHFVLHKSSSYSRRAACANLWAMCHTVLL